MKRISWVKIMKTMTFCTAVGMRNKFKKVSNPSHNLAVGAALTGFKGH
jgi:hypothetical protein